MEKCRSCGCNASRCVQIVAEILTFSTPILLAGAVLFYSYDLYRNGNEEELIAWFSAGGFVLITFPVSLFLIVQHLTHWYMPNVQKYVVRIIWMVPIYSVESWLSLRFREFALYIETMRECYEAYVIYSFMYYLIALIGDEAQLIAILRKKPKERGNHLFPLNYCFEPWNLGRSYLHHCKMGVFQYVLIKNICAIISITLEKTGHLCEGSFSLRHGYIYVVVINTGSQLWALYCLSMFYLAFKEELKAWNPVGKFLSVKLVIFFTWWQSLMVNFASAVHMIPDSDDDKGWTISEVNKGMQDYLICIEMLVAAIAFNYTFTHKDYRKAARHKREADLGEERLFSPRGAKHGGASTKDSVSVSGGSSVSRMLKSESSMLSSPMSMNRSMESEDEHREDKFGHNGDPLSYNDDDEEKGTHLQSFDDEEDSETERKPFFSAFLQSAVPDDVMRDIRKITSGQPLYDGSPLILADDNESYTEGADRAVEEGGGGDGGEKCPLLSDQGGLSNGLSGGLSGSGGRVGSIDVYKEGNGRSGIALLGKRSGGKGGGWWSATPLVGSTNLTEDMALAVTRIDADGDIKDVDIRNGDEGSGEIHQDE